jgi:hypothetical protein
MAKMSNQAGGGADKQLVAVALRAPVAPPVAPRSPCTWACGLRACGFPSGTRGARDMWHAWRLACGILSGLVAGTRGGGRRRGGVWPDSSDSGFRGNKMPHATCHATWHMPHVLLGVPHAATCSWAQWPVAAQATRRAHTHTRQHFMYNDISRMAGCRITPVLVSWT